MLVGARGDVLGETAWCGVTTPHGVGKQADVVGDDAKRGEAGTYLVKAASSWASIVGKRHEVRDAHRRTTIDAVDGESANFAGTRPRVSSGAIVRARGEQMAAATETETPTKAVGGRPRRRHTLAEQVGLTIRAGPVRQMLNGELGTYQTSAPYKSDGAARPRWEVAYRVPGAVPAALAACGQTMLEAAIAAAADRAARAGRGQLRVQDLQQALAYDEQLRMLCGRDCTLLGAQLGARRPQETKADRAAARLERLQQAMDDDDDDSGADSEYDVPEADGGESGSEMDE